MELCIDKEWTGAVEEQKQLDKEQFEEQKRLDYMQFKEDKRRDHAMTQVKFSLEKEELDNAVWWIKEGGNYNTQGESVFPLIHRKISDNACS